jgi:hypothetical protein
MKKLIKCLLSLFEKKPKPTPSKTTHPPKPTPSSVSNKVYSYNVNGLEEDINNVCDTGVLTIHSKCKKLDSFCVVYSNFECTDSNFLVGKHFHDYTNDLVYFVQEDGSIISMGRCKN